MYSSSHPNLNQYLGKVFFWNWKPTFLWHIQGILDVNGDCPKILVVSAENDHQSAVIPGGLFHDSLVHGLLQLSDRPQQWQLSSLPELSECCHRH